jgi:flagellar biosynthesis/type III secretory pathway chaperone
METSIAKIEEIKDLMKAEIRLMRELLSNMHQEEVALILFDKNGWTMTLQQRFSLMQSLASLRQHRQEVTYTLTDGSGKSCQGRQKLPALNDEDSIELALLAEQVLTLAQKVHEQNSKNQLQMHNFEGPAKAPEHLAIPLPHPAAIKTSVATYPLRKR